SARRPGGGRPPRVAPPAGSDRHVPVLPEPGHRARERVRADPLPLDALLPKLPQPLRGVQAEDRQRMISLRHVSNRFPGRRAPAVGDLSLEIEEGETVVLVGPSGCGKTTTMRMINRLIEPTSGEIWLDGRNVLHQDPVQLRRGIGYVIQSIGLLPHRTVAQNIATVPRLGGWDDAKVDRRVQELARPVRLEPDLRSLQPA